MKPMSKKLTRAIRAVPRGFFLPCRFGVDPKRSKPRRELCDRNGLLYGVSGGIVTLDIPLCPRHRDRLRSQGLKISLAPPIAQQAAKKELTAGTKITIASFPQQKELIA